MKELVGLKAATDSFSSETRNWQMKIELIAKLEDDEKGVEILMKQLREDVEGTERAKEFQKLLRNKEDSAELHDVGLDDIFRPSLIGRTEKVLVRRTKVLGISELGISG